MRLKFNPDNVKWFNDVGIACSYDEQEKRWSYYIKSLAGLNPELDYFAIIDWGNHFPADAGAVLFGHK